MHILDIREDPGSDVRHSDANRFPQKNPIQNSRPREKSQNEKTLCKFVRDRLRLGKYLIDICCSLSIIFKMVSSLKFTVATSTATNQGEKSPTYNLHLEMRKSYVSVSTI